MRAAPLFLAAGLAACSGGVVLDHEGSATSAGSGGATTSSTAPAASGGAGGTATIGGAGGTDATAGSGGTGGSGGFACSGPRYAGSSEVVYPAWSGAAFSQLKRQHPPALAALAASLGYADQSHFARDFKLVIGQTPRSFTRSGHAAAPG